MPKTPAVLLIVFNRPTPTARVFAAIRAAQPAHLYVASDGPRLGKEGESAQVAEVRRLVTAVDWPCEVHTRFLKTNIGCGRAVSSAIEWFLDAAGEGIILEDDCLPAPAFFEYAGTMLEKFRHDERVGVISGTNIAPEVTLTSDYAFSRIITCWGWATWRRTWTRYQLQPAMIQSTESWVASVGLRPFRVMEKQLRRILAGDIHTWDYQLLVQQLRLGQLTVIPRYNLVLNIGFDGTGTHYSAQSRPWWVPRYAFNFKGQWEQSVPLLTAEQWERHCLITCHRGVGQLARLGVKLLRCYANWRQGARPDRWQEA